MAGLCRGAPRDHREHPGNRLCFSASSGFGSYLGSVAPPLLARWSGHQLAGGEDADRHEDLPVRRAGSIGRSRAGREFSARSPMHLAPSMSIGASFTPIQASRRSRSGRPRNWSVKRFWEMIPAAPRGRPEASTEESTENSIFRYLRNVCAPRVNRWYETSVYPLGSGLSLCSRDITARRKPSEYSGRVKNGYGWRRKQRWWVPGPTTSWTTAWSGLPNWKKSSDFFLNPFTGSEEAFFELIHRDDRSAVREVFARCKQDQALFETEFRYSHGATETRWMLVRGRGFVDDSGRPSRLVGIGIDVTVQKRTEEKLRHTQRLASSRILAGGIAHDFNNLLGVIIGNANLTSRMISGHHSARAPLEEIELASTKAASLTRQMLAYAGRGHVEIDRLQVSTIIRDIERLVRSVISQERRAPN